MSNQKILVVYNPISGKGKSKAEADALSRFLLSKGYKVELNQSDELAENCVELFSALHAIIIVGGDGTLMKHLATLSQSATPIYMLPTGNESLFARAFSMSKNHNSILERLERYQPTSHYIGTVGTQKFFSMVSVGLDSQVVEKISRQRSGPIGHSGYFLPTIKSVLSHKPPRISLSVDGQKVIDNESGYLIIANSSQYALRTNYLPEASSKKANLVGRFFPYNNIVKFIGLSLPLVLGFSKPSSKAPFFVGECFEISTTGSNYPVQADGDFVGKTPIKVSANAETIKVL